MFRVILAVAILAVAILAIALAVPLGSTLAQEPDRAETAYILALTDARYDFLHGMAVFGRVIAAVDPSPADAATAIRFMARAKSRVRALEPPPRYEAAHVVIVEAYRLASEGVVAAIAGTLTGNDDWTESGRETLAQAKALLGLADTLTAGV